uniref:Cyclic nucleotide binding domain containing 1 n=1 Tax=Oryctolagus cuniculus TaxID=9986 RepID=A0A5F9D2A4_RABIT
MPMSTLPAAILSHMIAINNVPPPPLRSIPSLKMSKHINYGQLNALCHIRGLQHSQSFLNIGSAHNTFMKQYPKIFLHKKPTLPKTFKQEKQRKPKGNVEDSQYQDPDDSHDIAVHIRKARGGQDLHGPKVSPEKIAEFLTILKKLPVHRTTHEHNIVWKMLKTIPDLNSRLNREHLKTISKNLISETWIKGSTVTGNDGFYIILKGVARLQPQFCNNLVGGRDSAVGYKPQTFSSFVIFEDLRSSEIAKLCSSLRDSKEMIKHENVQKFKLIHKCPYYEEWPTLSINELVALIKWKKFPPGHVIVESGNIMSFVAYINSGYCNIYRSIIGLVRLQTNKVVSLNFCILFNE